MKEKGPVRKAFGWLISPRLLASKEMVNKYGGLSFYSHKILIEIIKNGFKSFNNDEVKGYDSLQGFTIEQIEDNNSIRDKVFFDFVYENDFTVNDLVVAHKSHAKIALSSFYTSMGSALFSSLFFFIDSIGLIPNWIIGVLTLLLSFSLLFKGLSELYQSWLIENRLLPEEYRLFKYIKNIRSSIPHTELDDEYIRIANEQYRTRHLQLVERSLIEGADPEAEGWSYFLVKAKYELSKQK